MDIQDIIIIGAGPAGIAAAIQLKRYGFNCIIFECNDIGGLLLNANRVDNYPGFPNGISGFKLVELFKKHLKRFEIKLYYEKVIKLDYSNNLFVVHTNKRKIKAEIAIIASGTKPKLITQLEISSYLTKKVLFEIHTILSTANKKIAIIGSGDAAFDYALNLGRNNTVFILNRGIKIKAMTILVDECKKNININYVDNSIVETININDDILSLSCKIKNKKSIMIVDYLIIAIGRSANLDMLSRNILTNFDEMISSNRMFLIGDVCNKDFRQVSMSVSDGIRAAMEIYSRR